MVVWVSLPDAFLTGDPVLFLRVKTHPLQKFDPVSGNPCAAGPGRYYTRALISSRRAMISRYPVRAPSYDSMRNAMTTLLMAA